MVGKAKFLHFLLWWWRFWDSRIFFVRIEFDRPWIAQVYELRFRGRISKVAERGDRLLLLLFYLFLERHERTLLIGWNGPDGVFQFWGLLWRKLVLHFDLFVCERLTVNLKIINDEKKSVSEKLTLEYILSKVTLSLSILLILSCFQWFFSP